MNYLTARQYKPEEIYITNLCNHTLPHAPKGKTVLIPEEKAREGIERIKAILKNYLAIEFVFPMSQQVNYWLQKLGFCEANAKFLELAEPKRKGKENRQPYYEPKQSGAFKLVCGNVIDLKFHKAKVIPILHAKNYPLKGNFKKAYTESYRLIKDIFNKNQ